MIRGLYTSAWSMLANQKRMDVISNNLANAGTTAFKKDTVVLESFPELLAIRINDAAGGIRLSNRVGPMVLSSDVGEIFTYYTQGQMSQTGNIFDLALRDDRAGGVSFFTVGIPGDGGQINEYYTRDGSFTLNSEGQLVTKDGFPVLGENGPIVLEEGDFSVSSDGTVIQNGVEVDRLRIRTFYDTAVIRKVGNNLALTEGAEEGEDFSGTVMQGYLEQSNVNVVREMIDMITVARAYEANQKIVQAQDGTLEKAVNEVGAVR